jgi:hypothetical protein
VIATGFAPQEPPVPPNPPEPPASRRVIIVGSQNGLPAVHIEAEAESEPEAETGDHGDEPAEPPRRSVERSKVVKHQRAVATRVPAEQLKLIVSDPMSTPDRAIENLTDQLKHQVNDWLSPDGVPLSWTPPRKVIHRMFVPDPPALEPLQLEETDITVFRARKNAAFTPQIRRELLGAYHREVANQRLGTLGGLLAFTLVGLGLVAGYIRADEATKGYFTWPLRALALVIASGASVALVRFLL